MKWARVMATAACSRSVANGPRGRPGYGTAAGPQPLKTLNSVPSQILCLNYGS